MRKQAAPDMDGLCRSGNSCQFLTLSLSLLTRHPVIAAVKWVLIAVNTPKYAKYNVYRLTAENLDNLLQLQLAVARYAAHIIRHSTPNTYWRIMLGFQNKAAHVRVRSKHAPNQFS